MSEEKYRVCKLVLMAFFILGALGIGGKISQGMMLLAENGRFVQYDRNKDTVTTGNSTQQYSTKLIDTRTGEIH